MKRKRSELEGRSKDCIEGRSSPCLAAESTFSLPGMPSWPEAHIKLTGIEIAAEVVRKEWMRRGWLMIG